MKLRVFELADELALIIYQATKRFSWTRDVSIDFADENSHGFGSIQSRCFGIEGCARERQVEYLHPGWPGSLFGRLRELHYQFSLAKRLGYFKEYERANNNESKIVETEKVLGALIRALRKT